MGIGCVLGIGMFLTGLSSWLLDYGTSWVDIINDVYIGYSGSFIGSIVGGIYEFVDGFILGFLIAWFYNKFR